MAVEICFRSGSPLLFFIEHIISYFLYVDDLYELVMRQRDE